MKTVKSTCSLAPCDLESVEIRLWLADEHWLERTSYAHCAASCDFLSLSYTVSLKKK